MDPVLSFSSLLTYVPLVFSKLCPSILTSRPVALNSSARVSWNRSISRVTSANCSTTSFGISARTRSKKTSTFCASSEVSFSKSLSNRSAISKKAASVSVTFPEIVILFVGVVSISSLAPLLLRKSISDKEANKPFAWLTTKVEPFKYASSGATAIVLESSRFVFLAAANRRSFPSEVWTTK